MQDLIQLAAALLLMTATIYLTHRRTYARSYAAGVAAGKAERAQLAYHQGHEDGLYEGRLKERMEIETRDRKQYEQGYADAVQAMLNETYAAMHADATAKSLSA